MLVYLLACSRACYCAYLCACCGACLSACYGACCSTALPLNPSLHKSCTHIFTINTFNHSFGSALRVVRRSLALDWSLGALLGRPGPRPLSDRPPWRSAAPVLSALRHSSAGARPPCHSHTCHALIYSLIQACIDSLFCVLSSLLCQPHQNPAAARRPATSLLGLLASPVLSYADAPTLSPSGAKLEYTSLWQRSFVCFCVFTCLHVVDVGVFVLVHACSCHQHPAAARCGSRCSLVLSHIGAQHLALTQTHKSPLTLCVWLLRRSADGRRSPPLWSWPFLVLAAVPRSTDSRQALGHFRVRRSTVPALR